VTGESVEEAFLTAVNVTAAVDTQVTNCLLLFLMPLYHMIEGIFSVTCWNL